MESADNADCSGKRVRWFPTGIHFGNACVTGLPRPYLVSLLPKRAQFRERKEMKRLALGFALLILLVLNFAYATQQQKASDEQAIRATVTDYIESYYTGDAGHAWRNRCIRTTLSTRSANPMANSR
jgi:hypothetical protein